MFRSSKTIGRILRRGQPTLSVHLRRMSTSDTVSIRLVGVPEQVNIPIQLCQEQGIFKKHGIDVEYTEIKEGTGKMLTLLEDHMADVALVVTDALIAGIAQSKAVSPVQLVGTYASSPLVWSVLGGGSKTLDGLGEGDGPIRVGVSRLGSGSQTMAFYLGHIKGWNPGRFQFHPVQTFDALKKGVKNGDFDFFMWEHFTTKPSVERGECERIGDVPTPWTAFSFASRPLISEEYTTVSGGKSKDTILKEAIYERLFPALSEGVKLFKHSGDDAMIGRIMRDYGHTKEDADTWMSRVEYAEGMRIDRARTADSVNILKSVGLVPQEFDIASL